MFYIVSEAFIIKGAFIPFPTFFFLPYHSEISSFLQFGNILPFLKRQILDSSKLKEFADDNFKFDKNGRKFSKRVENTEGKREIARYEPFLLFPQCFQNTCNVDT